MLKSKIFRAVIITLQTIITLAFLSVTVLLDFLPVKYLIILMAVLAFFLAFTAGRKFIIKNKTVKSIFAILICIILSAGCYYIIKTTATLNTVAVGDNDTKIDSFSVVVLTDDPAESLEDAKNYDFGIVKKKANESLYSAIAQINEDLGTEIKTVDYSEINTQINALYLNEVKAIIINEAYRDTIDELFPGFSDKSRILKEKEVTTDIIIEPTVKEITDEAFTVYISGIDTYGSISKTSRSDVNIIASVNPVTRQILLTNTPRDYYIPCSFADGGMDKLTHAGLYGVDASIKTLEDYYDIDIDYYLRVNFSSLVGIVDSLGGVTVNSDYAFEASGYSFKAGENELDGDKALAFSRERYAFSSGDNQRGINQMLVIKAMLKKAMSPVILINYGKIMDNISGSFETNMSADEISGLIKMQLNDMAEWNIVTNAVTGSDSSQTTYTSGSQEIYVMIPDKVSVSSAKTKMQQVINGNIIN